MPTHSRSRSPPPKIYRACHHCVRSKTRCEGLTTRGCARCRRRETECSLAGILNLGEPIDGDGGDLAQSSSSQFQSTSYVRPSSSGNHGSPVERRPKELEQLRNRIAQLETAYTTLLHSTLSTNDTPNSVNNTTQSSSQSLYPTPPTLGSLALPSPTSLSNSGSGSASAYPSAAAFNGFTRCPDVRAFRKALFLNPRHILFDERVRCLAPREGYPDMVARGLVSRTQVNAMFQLFKSQFSSISPMIPFLLTTRSPPKHSFVIVAAMTYIPTACPPPSIIDESVLYAMTGSADTDVMMALYILSFSPSYPGTDPQVPLSPLQLIALAYGIGEQLGLEIKAERALGGSTEDLLQPWAADRLEELALWEAVKLRYCILQIDAARCAKLPTSYASRFPAHPSEHVRQCISSLQAQDAIVGSCRHAVLTMAEEEIEAASQVPDVLRVHQSLTRTGENLKHLSSTFNESWLLRLTASSLTYNLALRFTFLAQTIPSPIHVDLMYQAQGLAGSSIITSSIALIEDFMAVFSEIGTEISIPNNLIVTFVTCLATSRRIAIVTRNIVPHPVFDEVKLSAAERYIANQPGLPGKALKEMWGDLDDTGPSHAGGSGAGDFDFNFDMLNLDFLDMVARFS